MKRRTFFAGLFATLAAPVGVSARQSAPHTLVQSNTGHDTRAVNPEVVSEDYKLPDGRGTVQFRLTRQGEQKECTIRIYSKDTDVSYRLAITPENATARTIIATSFWQSDVVSEPMLGSVIVTAAGEVVPGANSFMNSFYQRVSAVLSAASEMSPEQRKQEFVQQVVARLDEISQEIRIQHLPSRAGQWKMRAFNALRPTPKP